MDLFHAQCTCPEVGGPKSDQVWVIVGFWVPSFKVDRLLNQNRIWGGTAPDLLLRRATALRAVRINMIVAAALERRTANIRFKLAADRRCNQLPDTNSVVMIELSSGPQTISLSSKLPDPEMIRNRNHNSRLP